MKLRNMDALTHKDARLAKGEPWRVGWSCWLIVCGVGCSGCYQSTVVPPTTSVTPLTRPLPAPVTVQPIEPSNPVEPLSPPSTQPIDPITANNPWKPTAELREWDYIVLHHTASDSGSVASIHEEHLKRKDKNGNSWLGIGYHFVIGNGNGMGDGDIEPTFRWRQQLQGAHAGVANYNQHGIGIVLIGNFEESSPTDAQAEAVKQLVRVLKREYHIASSKIIGHSDVKATECPGKLFPLSEIRDGIAMENKPAVIEMVNWSGESRK